MLKILPKSIESDLLKYKTRHGRKKSDFIIVEGLRCCQEALFNQPDQIRFQIISSDFNNFSESPHFPTYSCDEQIFNTLSFTENPQGMMLILNKMPFQSPIFSDPFLLVLDGLQEPGNMGTILRTANALGLKEVAITKGTVDPFNPKTIRAGMGAQFSLKFSTHESLHDLLNLTPAKGKSVWLTTPQNGISCYDSNFKLSNSILVFGEEGDGISDLSCGKKVSIPMPGKAESLNVAQAATLLMFEGVRQNLFKL